MTEKQFIKEYDEELFYMLENLEVYLCNKAEGHMIIAEKEREIHSGINTTLAAAHNTFAYCYKNISLGLRDLIKFTVNDLCKDAIEHLKEMTEEEKKRLKERRQ